MEYLSQAVRAKAEECLAAVDDGRFPSYGHTLTSAAWQCSNTAMQHTCSLLHVELHAPWHYAQSPRAPSGLVLSFQQSHCMCEHPSAVNERQEPVKKQQLLVHHS